MFGWVCEPAAAGASGVIGGTITDGGSSDWTGIPAPGLVSVGVGGTGGVGGGTMMVRASSGDNSEVLLAGPSLLTVTSVAVADTTHEGPNPSGAKLTLKL